MPGEGKGRKVPNGRDGVLRLFPLINTARTKGSSYVKLRGYEYLHLKRSKSDRMRRGPMKPFRQYTQYDSCCSQVVYCCVSFLQGRIMISEPYVTLIFYRPQGSVFKRFVFV